MLLAACGTGAASPSPLPLDVEIVLAPGESVGSELRLTFDRVASDSRCPADVQCIWEGDALVVATLRAAASNCPLELHTAGSLAHEAACGAYRVRLSALAPGPRASSPVPSTAYRATFVVTAAP